MRNHRQPRHATIVVLIVPDEGCTVQDCGRGDPGIGTFETTPRSLGGSCDLAADGINLLARMLCEQQSLDPSRIADVTVAGNTAMHHLFLGLPVDRLGVAPFAAAVSSGFDVKARDAGIMAMPGAYVHLLPLSLIHI